MQVGVGYMFDFGDNLKKLRKEKKMSQKVLAAKVNVSESMICRYEKGEIYPQFETLHALSGILNVSLDELCGTQTRGTISVYNLSGEQIEIVQNLVKVFKNQNVSVKKNLSVEDYELLGHIVVELTKKS